MNKEHKPDSRSGYGTWEHARRKLAGGDLGWFGQRLSWLLAKLDYRFRTFDFGFNRSYDGWFAKRLGFQGHPFIVLLIPALLAVYIVFGPRLPIPWHESPPGLLQGLAWLAAAWVVLVAGTFVFRGKHAFWFQMAWATVLCGLIWWAAGPDSTAAGHMVYRHLLLVFIPAILVPVALASKLLALLLLGRQSDQRKRVFRERLKQTELFQSPGYPAISFLKFLRGLLSVPMYNLVPFLWLPALLLVAVFLPGSPLLVKTVSTALIWLIVLTLLNLDPRLNAINTLLRRILFTGGPLVISIIVILLGIGRLAEMQYVSTIIDSEYQLPLFLIIFCAYAYFWFFEYWINSEVCAKLITILRADEDKPEDVYNSGKIKYNIAKGCIATSVRQQDRVLQIHGGARFVAIGQNRKGTGENFQLYDRLGLFERLATSAQGKDESTTTAALADLRARLRFYFSFLNILVTAGLAVLVWVVFAGPQLAQQQVIEPGVPQSSSLEQLIFEDRTKDHVVLMSASGGGTRAALYTVGVLNGLREEGLIPDLKLASGVSGGGASLAYFAGHRQSLLNGDSDAWHQFQCTMDDPFVWDVLDGVAEWRIFANEGLGELLTESFERRFDDGQMTLGKLDTNFTLILNTALAGSLSIQCADGETGECNCRADETFPECAHRLRERTRGVNSGGRLIFTNSDSAGAFPGLVDSAPLGQQLKYVVVQAPVVPLTTAAALNANFPPVFPNAAVDLQAEKVRYWVTDGGAVENRGILSLLFALRDNLMKQPTLESPSARPKIPQIHIVVAEASGGGTGYSKLPGVSSKFGAPTQIASQLMKELLEEIRDELERIAGVPARDLIDIHYLAMPGPLRIDGGLGTHWMLARDVRLGDPGECGPARPQKQIKVSGLAMRNAIYGLFLKDRGNMETLTCADDRNLDVKGDVQRIWKLLEEEPGGGECWPESWRDDWDALLAEIRTPVKDLP